jgi:hypothetical protein
MEITTANKINGALAVLREPQFYLTMLLILFLFLAGARAKRTAHSITTKVGRLGLVLHWASLLVAAVLLCAAGLILTQAKQVTDPTVVVSGLLAGGALLVWLVGKSLRYILTGPPNATTAPVRTAAPVRNTSLPPSGARRDTQGPWGPTREA